MWSQYEPQWRLSFADKELAASVRSGFDYYFNTINYCQKKIFLNNTKETLTVATRVTADLTLSPNHFASDWIYSLFRSNRRRFLHCVRWPGSRRVKEGPSADYSRILSIRFLQTLEPKKLAVRFPNVSNKKINVESTLWRYPESPQKAKLKKINLLNCILDLWSLHWVARIGINLNQMHSII